MICEEIRPQQLKIYDWFKINDNEVSTVKSIAEKPKTVIVRLTNRRRYILHKEQSRVERVIYMGVV